MPNRLFWLLIAVAVIAAVVWAIGTANCPSGQKPVRGVVGFTCVADPR